MSDDPSRTWTGGGYEGREGIVVTPSADGITISAWYDGGVDLDFDAHMSWAELEAMRSGTQS